MARRQEKEKKQKPIRYFDYSLLFLIIFLLCFGLVMLYRPARALTMVPRVSGIRRII